MLFRSRSWGGELFVPWTQANAAAVAGGQERFTVMLRGFAWEQKPQKYHAKSWDALRKKLASVPDRSKLDAILADAGIAVT